MPSSRFSGTIFRLELGATALTTKPVSDEMDLTVDSAIKSIEISSKDDGDNEDFVQTGVSTSVKFSGLVNLGAAGTNSTRVNLGDLLGWRDTKARPFFKIKTAVAGDVAQSGQCIIASINIKATHRDVAKIDFELKVVGNTTISVNA